MIEIRTPIWNGGKRCVGIAEFRIPYEDGDFVRVEINWRNKDKQLIYPNPFKIEKTKVMKYPRRLAKHSDTTWLYLVPIADMIEIKPQNNKPNEQQLTLI